MMLTIARGVGQGRRIALFTVLGNVFVAGFVQVSFLFWLVAVVHAWPVALDLFRWAGAAYLMWLGIKMIATSGTDTRLRKTAKISDWSAVKEGALNSLITQNPCCSCLLFFLSLSILPRVLSGCNCLFWVVSRSWQELFQLGSVAMASGTFGNWLSKHPGFIKWQERFTGVVMIGLGIRMLFGGSGVVSKSSS
jgi:threonine/homoserine/homoserine lactone efflux protein